MPKMKTRRGATKRMKVTGSGKIKRAKAFRRHNMTKTNHRRKKQNRGIHLVAKSDQKPMKLLLPYD